MTSLLAFLALVADLPRVLDSLPAQLYLARSMLGRIECPVDAHPPAELTTWSRDGRVIDVTRTTRMRVTPSGALVIRAVTGEDEGRYACTPESRLGAGKTSHPVQVIVRGER